MSNADHAVGRHPGDRRQVPVTYVKGDDNGDGLLTVIANGDRPDEMWTYTHDRHHATPLTRWSGAVEASQIVGTDVSCAGQGDGDGLRYRRTIDVDVVKKKKYPAARHTTFFRRSNRPAGQTALPDVVPAGERRPGDVKLPCEGLEGPCER